MKKLTLIAYAKKHKLSLYSVMKMIKEGAVTILTEQEEGKEVIYILENETEQTTLEAKISISPTIEKELELLKREIAYLKSEIEELKRR